MSSDSTILQPIQQVEKFGEMPYAFMYGQAENGVTIFVASQNTMKLATVIAIAIIFSVAYCLVNSKKNQPQLPVQPNMVNTPQPQRQTQPQQPQVIKPKSLIERIKEIPKKAVENTINTAQDPAKLLGISLVVLTIVRTYKLIKT